MRPVSFSTLILPVIATLSAFPALATTIHVPAEQPTIQAGVAFNLGRVGYSPKTKGHYSRCVR